MSSLSSSSSSASPPYILHYWPGIPGRGEFVRLAFESVGKAYSESKSPMGVIQRSKTDTSVSHFAPPVLEVQSRRGGSAFLSQTAAILSYLAPILHLDGVEKEKEKNKRRRKNEGANGNKGDGGDGEGEGEGDDNIDDYDYDDDIRRAQVNQVTLTVLDLNNETHDVHHPIAPGAYYEEQKQEAKRRADDFRSARVPKFFATFQSTIKTNSASDHWLIGKDFTVADLSLFQVVDGLHFAFPRLMKALKESEKYDLVFALREKVASIDKIAKYLESDRRQAYGNGIFRHYPELDGES